MKLMSTLTQSFTQSSLLNLGSGSYIKAPGLSPVALLPQSIDLVPDMRLRGVVRNLPLAIRKQIFIPLINLSSSARSSRPQLAGRERNLHRGIAHTSPKHDRRDLPCPEHFLGEEAPEELCSDESTLDSDRKLHGEKMYANPEEETLGEVQIRVREGLRPGLYLVGTPIGNMEDITLRALRVLRSAACILAEDTRHSAKLLQYYQIRTPTLSYHKFNEYARIRELIGRLNQGDALALISDAGMPGISDPGSELVKACIDANVEVFPIPGPSASVTALVASGLPTKEFSFVGFLPERPGSRKKKLVDAAKESATQIFFIPPHKLCRFLEDMISAFGPLRRCAIAREMTKLHEEFWRGTLDEAKEIYSTRNPRGELTLIVEGVPEGQCAQQVTEEELKHRLRDRLDAGESPSEATKQVVQESFARRNLVYSLALEISKKPK